MCSSDLSSPPGDGDDDDNGGDDHDNYDAGMGSRSPQLSPHRDMGSQKGDASSRGPTTPTPSGQDAAQEQRPPPTPMKPREAKKDVGAEFKEWKKIIQDRAKDAAAQLEAARNQPETQRTAVQTPKAPTV